MNCITVGSACNGELMNNGFVFAAKNAICTEANYSYPCLATKGTCKASYCNVEIAHGSVTGCKDVSTNSEKTLMLAVTQQSASITIETDQFSFQSYSYGVSTAPCSTKLDMVFLSSAAEPTLSLITGRWKILGEPCEMSRFTSGFLAAVLEQGRVGIMSDPPSYFQYLAAQSASLKAERLGTRTCPETTNKLDAGSGTEIRVNRFRGRPVPV